MPRLFPFPALRFADCGPDLSTRIAPPYDVLDQGPKQALLLTDPFNIVAVDLPVTPPKTVGPDAAYQQAGRTFRQWIAHGILRHDPTPALYAYEQQFHHASRPFRRRGLLATVELQPFNQPNGIWAHEKTIRGGLDDRLRLMNATAAQLSPVFGFFSDPHQQVLGQFGDCFEHPPHFHGTTANDGVVHRCWAVTEPRRIQAVQQLLADIDVFIADGHHRYTTALTYAGRHPDNPHAQRCLFALVAMQDPGMIVLPYHRVLCGLEGLTLPRIIESLSDDGRWVVRPFTGPLDQLPDALPRAGHHGLGLYDPASDSTWLMATTDPDPLADSMADRPACWRTLDAAIVQHMLVEQTLQPLCPNDSTITYQYTSDLKQLVRMARAERGRAGVIVQPARLESVVAVARAGQVMPAKSTFFYPKLATGLVIHDLAAGSPPVTCDPAS